ncbi:Aste57867_12469 [Aphanomyces stellatus]|uniref:Aste57867_12469 protein n=1 Tax=Aphanomyces stellatus TaxID=120398 RepID=A0A485KW13_9STRA|nr:hypothetical protein As57867_012423 [Aphanomyces stellatus]VFT89320.1 Aste57867_12469 [Aphanomyces stellatus]
MHLKDEMAKNTNPPAPATFIRSLFNLTRTGTPYVDWSVDGSSFRILDVKRFAKEVLPRFFKHSNMSSFQRQLNYFAFKKATKSHQTIEPNAIRPGMAEFHHPWFRRDMSEDSLRYFRRKKTSKIRSAEPLMDVYATNFPPQVALEKEDPKPIAPSTQRVNCKSSTKKGPHISLPSFLKSINKPKAQKKAANARSKSKKETFTSTIKLPSINIEPLLHSSTPLLPRIPAASISLALQQPHANGHDMDISWGESDQRSDGIVPWSSGDHEWLNTFDWEALHDILPLLNGPPCHEVDKAECVGGTSVVA